MDPDPDQDQDQDQSQDQFEILNTPKAAASSIAELTSVKYRTIVEGINALCAAEAQKGNLTLVLQEKHFTDFGLTVNEDNFRTLKYFLKKEDYDVTYNVEATTDGMTVQWMHLVCNDADKDAEPYVSKIKFDGNLDLLVCEHSTNVHDIKDMKVYVRKALNDIKGMPEGWSGKEKTIVAMFCTILQMENKYPERNDEFLNDFDFMCTAVNKMEEFVKQGLPWAVHFKRRFIQINNNRRSSPVARQVINHQNRRYFLV